MAAVERIEDMGRRRRAAQKQAITLPKLGPNGDLARQENARVAGILARDAEEAEREHRRLKHVYNDQPAAMQNYECADPGKTLGERRYRALPANHPLVKAYFKHKIPENEFNGGNIYRILFERANDPAGRDSTLTLTIDTSRTGDGEPAYKADAQAAKDAIAGLHARMGEVDALIAQKFCGLGLPIAASVDGSVICPPSARLFRLREALRALEKAINSGVRLPEIDPAADRRQDKKTA